MYDRAVPRARQRKAAVSADLAGVIPITVTPFDDHSRVDEAGIATLVDFEAGAASTA